MPEVLEAFEVEVISDIVRDRHDTPIGKARPGRETGLVQCNSRILWGKIVAALFSVIHSLHRRSRDGFRREYHRR